MTFSRFKTGWQEKEQDAAIERAERVAAATSEKDRELSIFLNFLGQIVWGFKRMGSMKDFDDASGDEGDNGDIQPQRLRSLPEQPKKYLHKDARTEGKARVRRRKRRKSRK